ncbi:MAG: DUF2268 domain-containing putative Zn-dependent protease [Pseudomonadota bacterium]
MTINLHILNSSGRFSEQNVDAMTAILTETARECSRLLQLRDLDIVVMNVPWAVIPRLGVNGFAYDQHQIVLQLDISHDHLATHLDSALRAVLAHELHHCARAAALGNSHSSTYGGSLVAEGLACCFEEEIGEPTPFYAVECAGDRLRKFSEKAKGYAKAERQSLPGHWEDWMFGRGSDDPEFPYQCGYSTGYALIKAWLKINHLRPSEAAGIDENLVLDPWLDGTINIAPQIAG